MMRRIIIVAVVVVVVVVLVVLVVEVVVIEEEVEVGVLEVEVVVASHSGCLLRRGGSQVEKREAEQTTSEHWTRGRGCRLGEDCYSVMQLTMMSHKK